MRASTMTTLTAAAALATTAVLALAGCPNKECSASGTSDDLDFTFDDTLTERAYDIHIVADLDSGGDNHSDYTADSHLTLTITGDGTGTASGAVVAEAWFDADGYTEEADGTLSIGQMTEQTLELLDLAEGCAWGEVCEVVAHLDLFVTGDLEDFEGTISAHFEMDGENYECDGSNFDGIEIEVTIEEI